MDVEISVNGWVPGDRGDGKRRTGEIEKGLERDGNGGTEGMNSRLFGRKSEHNASGHHYANISKNYFHLPYWNFQNSQLCSRKLQTEGRRCWLRRGGGEVLSGSMDHDASKREEK